MKNNKILTVVVPTYNTEKYLDRCLLSLVYDTDALEKVEILVVNDGSRDASLKIARSYEKKYPNSITVIDKENGGHGSTINTGLAAAKGKYFRVVDSDDWVNIDDFGTYVNALFKLDTDIILTNYSRELVYNGATQLVRYKGLDYENEYNLDSMNLEILGDDYFYLATSAIKTSKLKEAGLQLDEHTFYVDMEYIILPIVHLSSFVYLDYDIYRYWIGRPQQSIDRANAFKNRLHHEKVIRRLVDFYATTDLNPNKKSYVEKIIILMLNSHYLVYCSQRVPLEATREARQFDKWLKKTSRNLYDGVSAEFPYIKNYRLSGFSFTRLASRSFRRFSNRLAKTERGVI